ncbi:MAG TPA: hypothetical protein VG796_04615 [Verrucomicrobiales bacterium]|nr:hypothetical protein [Verrucomicrobiales bacterium]
MNRRSPWTACFRIRESIEKADEFADHLAAHGNCSNGKANPVDCGSLLPLLGPQPAAARWTLTGE